MLRSLDAASDRFLESLAGINRRLDRAQSAISSGKRLNLPSDEPDQVSRLLSVRSSLASLEQTQSNLSRFKTEADTAEGALQSAVKFFDRVRTLGSSGASGIQTAQTRLTIADELSGILERMVALANTQADGRYLFSGDSDGAAAYAYDSAQSPPWRAYQGSAATRRILDPSGVAFSVSRTAAEIFDNPDASINVYTAIDNLRAALVADDDQALQLALEPLSGVSSHLNQMLGFYGNVQNRLTESTDTSARMKLQLQSQLSDIEDADVTTAIVELQQLKYQQQAALDVRGKLPKVSLFDFLG